MGTGFVCVTPGADAERALGLLRAHHPAAARIGRVTPDAGTVALTDAGLVGDEEGLRAA